MASHPGVLLGRTDIDAKPEKLLHVTRFST